MQSLLKGNALEDGAELLAEVKSESFIGQPIGYYLNEKQVAAGGMITWSNFINALQTIS